jgi:hypothetical protein
MAKAVFSAGIPADQPIEAEPGITHRERDFFAQESPTRGFYEGFPHSHIDVAKGNRGMSGLPPAHPLSSPRGPFANLRGGR